VNVFYPAIFVPLLLCSGCLGPVKSLYPAAADQRPRTIYVVSHGWHTGLVIPCDDISPRLWRAARDFAPARYIEVGWGDDGFYRAPKITFGITLRAIFWPTPSVLHLVAVNDPPTEFAGSKMVKVELSAEGFERMCAFIGQTHEYSVDARPFWLAPGLYGESAFYRARGRYYFPKTCNHWTARALRKAGCPITPIYCATAGNVLFQTARFGSD
jgi:uncharacterized protein (TIGR02117 family)